ncbi:Methylthioribose-1-phosphate isomerase [Gryllus bimaculatus]|nr:Methylthioribose-1-phosphate isomerase [Gryllus bimaculatus]
MTLKAIKYENGKLEVLDQLLLPLQTEYVNINGVEDGWHVIHKMQVRGAPAIAIVGCLSLAVELRKEIFEDKKILRQEVEGKLNYLVSARPTAVNMKAAADQLIELVNELDKNNSFTAEQMKLRFLDAIEAMLQKDLDDNLAIGRVGADALISQWPGDAQLRVLTHCNTGSLATSGYGTALGIIRNLHSRGLLEHAYCTETRPYNQGARLTAYELLHERIPATLLCDSMVAALMRARRLAAVVLGRSQQSHSIKHRAPYHSPVDCGTFFCIEVALCNQRLQQARAGPSLVGVCVIGLGQFCEERPAPSEYSNERTVRLLSIKCWNPAFDVTPADLISGIITERGLFKPAELLSQRQVPTESS